MAHEKKGVVETGGPASAVATSRDPEIDEDLLAALRDVGHRWPQRAKESWVYPGAARFSDDPQLKDPVWIIKLELTRFR